MTVQIAHLYATLCLGIVFFQIALIVGLPLGEYTQGGQHKGALPLSGRIIAVISIPIVVFQGLAILSAAGFPGLGFARWTGWVALGVSVISCVLNWITPSKRERAVWGPVMTVMAGFAAHVMIATLDVS
jgi:cytochrome bd-type quinol oxidase subunit 2